MNRVKTTAAALTLGLALAVPLASHAQEGAPDGAAETGMQTYQALGCWTCHGFSGQGASTGPRLTEPMLPYDAFLEQLRQPRDVMPPYEAAIVPDQDVADIYAYLAAIPAPEAPEEIPMLQGYLDD